MKITSVETLRIEEFPNLIWVQIHTDKGITGLGETFMCAKSIEAYIHETAAPVLLGRDPGMIDYHSNNLRGFLGFRGSGVEMRGNSAIDIALWDIFGKEVKQPVYKLLGGECREKIRTYNTCAGYNYLRSTNGQTSSNWGTDAADGPYEDLQGFLNHTDKLAVSLLEEGITAMKIWPFDHYAEEFMGQYISNDNLKKALIPFEKIRKAVGDKMEIMVECLSQWNLPTAVQISRALEEFNPYWIEDPIRPDSLETLGEFRAKTKIPVTLSETLSTRWGYRDLFEAKAVDIVMPDLSWCGGITEAKKISSMAETYHYSVAPHDCTGPVVFVASVHLSINLVNALIQESVRAFYKGCYQELVTNLPKIKNGYISKPTGIGLGVELCESVFSRSDLVRMETK